MVLRSVLVSLWSAFLAAGSAGAQTVGRSLECVGHICKLTEISSLENGEMIAGGTRMAGNERLAWFGKFEPTGEPIWFVLDPLGRQSEGLDVETVGQDIFVGGSTGGSENAFVRKLSAAGATIWERLIPGEGAMTAIRDLSASPNGRIYVATSKLVRKETSSIILTALSPQGELLWETTAPGPPDAPFGRTMALAGAQVLALDDGCLLFVAKGKKLALFRFSQGGELVSSQDISLPMTSEPEDTTMLTIGEPAMSPDGGFWLQGTFGPFSRTSWIARLNPAGAVTWSHAQPTKGDWRYQDIAAMPDNSVVVVGRAPVGNERGFYSARISAGGKTLWSRTAAVHLKLVDPGVAIAKSGGNFFVAGASDPMSPGGAWLTRLQADTLTGD